MTKPIHTIGVVAPSRRLDERVPERIQRVLDRRNDACEFRLRFHEHCFKSDGHFAGSDQERCDAFVEYANSHEIDTIWFARGGYGAARFDDSVFVQLNQVATTKTFVGYSDTGFLLARLYRQKIGRCVHGPMPVDVSRPGGIEAVDRVFDYLKRSDPTGVLSHPADIKKAPAIALNLTVLVHLISTDWMPDLDKHVLMIEDVGEHLYALDRSMFALVNSSMARKLSGIAMGRFSETPENDVEFGQTIEEIVTFWCDKASIPFLGQCNIGHDSSNGIVEFGSPVMLSN